MVRSNRIGHTTALHYFLILHNVLGFCKIFLKYSHFYTKFLHARRKYGMLTSDFNKKPMHF